MHETQERILELNHVVDIEALGVRELARRLGVHPQTAKYHKEKLRKAGKLDLGSGIFGDIDVESNVLGDADLVTLPFLGSASCGPASAISNAEPEGKIAVSSRILKSRNYKSLFALKANGNSMDQTNIDGNPIEDGDYVIVDNAGDPSPGDRVVAIVGGLANIKRFYPEVDEKGFLKRIVLTSESSQNFEPIFIDPKDQQEGLIAGVAVQVVKAPQLTQTA